jgi:signal peptidase I
MRRRVLGLANLAGWAFVAVAAALVAWVAITALAFGWRPVVIEGRSMEPAIHRGDVAMIDVAARTGRLAAGTTITFRDADGALVTHRIATTEPDGSYRTRGDANSTDDIRLVAPSDVVGAGRLVVPAVGLPVVMVRSGDGLPIVLGALVLLGCLGARGSSPRPRRRRVRATAGAHQAATMASREMLHSSLQRMRVGAAILLGIHITTTVSGAGAPSRWWITVAVASAMGLLGAYALASAAGRRVGRASTTLDVLALAIDLASAVATVTVLRPLVDEVRWALLLLPILEAAVRFRLVGVLLGWSITSASYLTIELLRLVGTDAASEIALGRVSTLVQRAGVVLLVALPGGYLSDHLLRAAAAHRAARKLAARRSELLEIVVSAGQAMNRLDGHQLERVAPAAMALGFAAADVCTFDSRSGWRSVTQAARESILLSPPAAHADALELLATGHPLVVVDPSDGEDAARDLDRAGLAQVFFAAMRGRDGMAVLRAGVEVGEAVTEDQLACLELLAREATVAIDNVELVARLRDAHDDLEHQANHDPLTTLANRRAFAERLVEASEQAAAEARPVSLLFLDLDRFKAVNDSHGHDVGDELLVAAAARLRRCVRAGDLLARLGGDEFTVLLAPDTIREGPARLAERIRASLAAPFRLRGIDVEIGVSIGIGVGVELEPTELMRRADVAMYHAKQRQDGWCEYAPALEAPSAARDLADRLTIALASDRLTLAYQPVVDLATGEVKGFEALARWIDDELGPVPPDVFIPVAEDAELIDQLGAWVLRHACHQARTWQTAYPGQSLTMAVNVSPLQLGRPGFVDTVVQILRTTRLAPTDLVLEVTERVVVGESEAAVLRALREVGVRVAIDDFGAGQSSLSYLRRLPLDVLKIDRAYVQVATADRGGVAILRSVVALGRDLGLEVIAEGVESSDQLDLLNDLGCDSAQGFLLHRPLDPIAASALLAGGHATSGHPVPG